MVIDLCPHIYSSGCWCCVVEVASSPSTVVRRSSFLPNRKWKAKTEYWEAALLPQDEPTSRRDHWSENIAKCTKSEQDWLRKKAQACDLTAVMASVKKRDQEVLPNDARGKAKAPKSPSICIKASSFWVGQLYYVLWHFIRNHLSSCIKCRNSHPDVTSMLVGAKTWDNRSVK